MREKAPGDERDVLDARTSARLSQRLRTARHMRAMTLKVLADAAGCSESLLSKIENGKALPSLPTLHRLVQALGMTMGSMFEDAEARDPVIFRAGDRSRVPHPAPDRPVTVEHVIRDVENHLMQCSFYHVAPGATGGGAHQHAGEEAGFLLDGQIELVIGGRPHSLGTGDAFAFRSDQPHTYRNVGDRRATVFWVSTPPLT